MGTTAEGWAYPSDEDGEEEQRPVEARGYSEDEATEDGGGEEPSDAVDPVIARLPAHSTGPPGSVHAGPAAAASTAPDTDPAADCGGDDDAGNDSGAVASRRPALPSDSSPRKVCARVYGHVACWCHGMLLCVNAMCRCPGMLLLCASLVSVPCMLLLCARLVLAPWCAGMPPSERWFPGARASKAPADEWGANQPFERVERWQSAGITT